MWSFKKFLFGACAGAVAAFSAGAFAQNVDAVTADELQAALEAAGLGPVTMLEDAGTGNPVAHGRAGENTFFVRALDCSGTPAACETLMFFANFELGRAATANDFRIADNFRDGQVFGRAYVLEDKGQVGVDYVIELGGGVSKEHLSQNISRWADVISEFIDKFRAGLGES
ncbi:MAG: YbjN domain-containing protein [Pseudomonadota bacterium]